MSGKIVDVLHQHVGPVRKGARAHAFGHPGFLFPSGPTSREKLNYCLIVDSVFPVELFTEQAQLRLGQMSSGVGVLEHATPKGPRQRRTIF